MQHKFRIEMEDLVLRPIEKEDIDRARSWRNKESIRKSFLYQDVISSSEQHQWYQSYLEKEDDIMFIIEFKDAPIGTAALYHIDLMNKEAEFGRLMIGEESARGNQIGYRATKLVCQFGFEKLNLAQIKLEVFSDNPYAKKHYIKAGFEEVERYVLNCREIDRMLLKRR